MTQRAKVTEAEMKRAIKAAAECGLTVRECVMSATQVRLIFHSLDEIHSTSDNLAPKAWPELNQ